jgi:hypothetical protein
MILLDRNQYVAKIIGKLNGEKVVDLGCRDKILKEHLVGDFDYIPVDFNPNINNGDFINHNLENGLPKEIDKIDIITAIDVLEHIENIHLVFEECLHKAQKMIVIALPNIAYYKFRFYFIISGSISGKYTFHEKKVVDRHRWLTAYYANIEFIKKNTPLNWKIYNYNFIAQRKRNFIFYYIEKFLSKFFPQLFVYENIFILKRTK